MQHIQHEFNGSIGYVCISSPSEPQTSCSLMYIQIILNKTINNNTSFLSSIAGMDQFTHWHLPARYPDTVHIFTIHSRKTVQLPGHL